jgi:hypothetical protein
MAVNSLSSEAVLHWMQNCAETYVQHKDELTELDAAIGDADHGANMARGFTAVQGKLAGLEGKDIGTIFKTVAMTLISTVGGASGPLYGTFFLQAAGPANGKMALTHEELVSIFAAGLQGLMHRGKAVLGGSPQAGRERLPFRRFGARGGRRQKRRRLHRAARRQKGPRQLSGRAERGSSRSGLGFLRHVA